MDVTFWFDFGSPNAFLSHRVIPAIAERTGARFDYVPILLGGLFKLTGNQAPMVAFGGVKNKLEYEARELQRFVARHAIADYRFNPHFPVNTLALMRGAVAAQDLGVFAAYVDTVFDAMWTRGLDMGRPEVVAQALSEAGLPAEKLFDLAQTAPVKQRLLDNTQGSFEAGAFGSPTFAIGSEIYFGKDRLRDVEDALLAARASTAR